MNRMFSFLLHIADDLMANILRRDDVRIFGICVSGQNCRVKSYKKLTVSHINESYSVDRYRFCYSYS
jgi:hypothetical protein